MKNKETKLIKKNNPGLSLILRTLKRVLKRDDEYIQKVLNIAENPDLIEIRHNGSKDYGKIVYVIKENTKYDGFGATIRYVLACLIFAKQRGFLPVIKLSNEFTYFDEDMDKKISNPWEYYFLPSEEVADENDAMNVCYCSYYHMKSVFDTYGLSAYNIDNYYDEQLFKLTNPLMTKYFSLKPDIINESMKLVNNSADCGKILGVHFRGTDYKQGYKGHPVFIDEDTFISEIKKSLVEGGFSKIFLATDEASIYDKLKATFSDIVILMHKDVYRGKNDRSIAFSEDSREYHHYRLGFEVARDIYTLSLCDGLLAGKSSVSYVSNLYKRSRNEKFEYLKILDKGNNEEGKSHLTYCRGCN